MIFSHAPCEFGLLFSAADSISWSLGVARVPVHNQCLFRPSRLMDQEGVEALKPDKP